MAFYYFVDVHYTLLTYHYSSTSKTLFVNVFIPLNFDITLVQSFTPFKEFRNTLNFPALFDIEIRIKSIYHEV